MQGEGAVLAVNTVAGIINARETTNQFEFEKIADIERSVA